MVMALVPSHIKIFLQVPEKEQLLNIDIQENRVRFKGGYWYYNKLSWACCQLLCFLALACHWGFFTAELISLLLFLHRCCFPVINTYTLNNFPHFLLLSCFHPLLLFLCLPLNYTVEGQRVEVIIDCSAALRIFCFLSCSPLFCEAAWSEESPLTELVGWIVPWGCLVGF